MDDIDYDIPFRFIVTGKYLAVHFDGTNFSLVPEHHLHGSIFGISYDNDMLIHESDGNTKEIGYLINHPDYRYEVFYIEQGSKYLSQECQWIDNKDEALVVQISYVTEMNKSKIYTTLTDSATDTRNPVSADGVDLYAPDALFNLYPQGHLNYSNADNFESKLIFGGNPYYEGITFKLSPAEDGKTHITEGGDSYLGVIMPPDLVDYQREECKEHNAQSRCNYCERCYTLGFESNPKTLLKLVPKGLPSMFVFYDGVFYYYFDVIKASYAEMRRVKTIEEASIFQFVSL